MLTISSSELPIVDPPQMRNLLASNRTLIAIYYDPSDTSTIDSIRKAYDDQRIWLKRSRLVFCPVSPQTAKEFKVVKVPQVRVYQDNKVIHRIVGLHGYDVIVGLLEKVDV
jgi:hypothetical protein